MKFQSNAAYTLSYSVYTIGYAAILSYASYYLLECGYSNSEIGILLAVSNIFAILLQIATADLADRSRRLSVSGILMILAGCFAATMIIGRTIHDAGIRMIPITNLVGCAFLVIGLLWSKALLKRTGTLSGQKNTQGTGSAEQITLSAFIRRHPRFFVLNFGILLLYFGHQVINGFMLQIVKNVGGTALDMSNFLSVTGVLEIIPLFFSSFLIRKTSSRAIVIALGSILGSIAGGAVLDHAGVRTLLILCTVLTAVGTVIITVSTERRNLPEPARPRM